MNKVLLIGTICLVVGGCSKMSSAKTVSPAETKNIETTTVKAEDFHDKMKTMTPEKMAEMWKKAATPVVEHAFLNEFVGKWDTTVKFWMHPRSKPDVSTGTSVNTMEMSGKFLKESYNGTWNGHPFMGIGFTGYHPMDKQFISVWMDSSSPIVNLMTGTYSAEKKSLSLNGNNTCPVSGEKMASRTVHTLVDKNKHILESYSMMPDGKEFKNMEIEYTRAKM
jgi:hypothetical protein